GVAVGWTSRFAGSRLGLAYTLTERLPGTLAALEEGRIDLRRGGENAEETDPPTPGPARAAGDAGVGEAGGRHSTPRAPEPAAGGLSAGLTPLVPRRGIRNGRRNAGFRCCRVRMGWLS